MVLQAILLVAEKPQPVAYHAIFAAQMRGPMTNFDPSSTCRAIGVRVRR
jgi:hypothetical protein